jgi:hypothetical protein
MKEIIEKPERHLKELLIFISGLVTGAALVSRKNIHLFDDDIMEKQPNNNLNENNKPVGKQGN